MSKINTNIHQSLTNLDFSRNANIRQLIIDWPRLQNVVRINGQPLAELFKGAGIDVGAELNPDDPILQAKFKKILEPLLPAKVNITELDAMYNQLAAVLHQGGLPFSLETQVVKSLTTQGRMFDSVKKGMDRRVDLVSTDQGFAVKELFLYNGNISKQDPDNPEFMQESNEIPLLTGKCEYDVEITATQVKPVFKAMQLSSPAEQLETMLQSSPENLTDERADE